LRDMPAEWSLQFERLGLGQNWFSPNNNTTPALQPHQLLMKGSRAALTQNGSPRQERDFSPRRPAPQYRQMRRQEQRDRKLRAKKRANGGPPSQVSTTCRIARLGGGGRSHMRTRLYCQIPC